MDGAKPWQTYLHVILPLLTPTLVVVTIISVLAGFTAFDLLWVMGAGYPGQRTLSLVVFMYFEAFQKGGWAFRRRCGCRDRRAGAAGHLAPGAAPGSRRTHGALMAVTLEAIDFDAIERRERSRRKAAGSRSSPRPSSA